MIKNCGIITYHRAHNYGAVLQAYALKKVIDKLGYSTKFIDYQHENLEKGYSFYPSFPNDSLSINNINRYVKDWIHLIIDFKRKKERYTAFEMFINKNIPLIDISSNENMHAIILGSDQIWNSKYTDGVDPAYYGILANITSSNIISYAASMGQSKLNSKEEIEFISYIKKLNHIGVREDSLKEYIDSVVDCDVNVNLDPTLLLNKEDWFELSSNNNIEINEPYILVYQVHSHDETNNIVDYLTEVLKIKVITLASRTDIYTSKDSVTNASPNDFIYLFRNASFVVTTSFHGTVFSIINEIPFITLSFSNDIDLRSRSVLQKIHLESRMISSLEDVKNLDLDIDFKEKTTYLDELRNESICFLKLSLETNNA